MDNREDERLEELGTAIERLEDEDADRRPMTQKERKAQLLIVALMTSRNVEEAAEKVGLSVRTVKTLMGDPEFRAEYQTACRMSVAQGIKYLTNMFGDVVQRVYEVLRDPATQPHVKIQAANLLLRYAFEIIQREADEQFRMAIDVFIKTIKEQKSGNVGSDLRLLQLAEAGTLVDDEA